MDRQDDFEFVEANVDEDIEIVDLVDEEAFDDISERNSFASDAKQAQKATHFTARQRRVQLLLTVSSVGLLLFLLLSSYAPMRNLLVQTLVPAPSTVHGKDQPAIESFYFDANPTWGQLYIDGKRVMHLPSVANANDRPLQLGRGKHLLRWVVSPFMSQQCTVSVPFNTTTDTCHFDLFTQYPKDIGAWLVRFPLSLAQLPRSMFTELVTAVQTELDTHAPTETVLPGETYAVDTTGETMRRATKPLVATLRYQLDVENTLDGVCSTPLEESTACTFNGQECYLFCAIPLLPNEIGTRSQSWDVFATVQASWQYSTQDGTIVAQNQPELLGTSLLYDHLIPLHLTWDGANWHVALRSFQVSLPDTQQQLDVACNTALNAVKSVLEPTIAEQVSANMEWQYISSTNPAEGCLSIATFSAGKGPSPVAYCLHRFGVFLAANDVAHRYWPKMPMADEHEQQLASQLAAMQVDV